jgi:hypothetical protein
MTDLMLFAGLDVHRKTISVALVDAAATADVRFYMARLRTRRIRCAACAGSCRGMGGCCTFATKPALATACTAPRL